MAEPQKSREALLGHLAAEPALAGLAKPDAGIFVWAGDGAELLWASPAARALGSFLTDQAGRIRPAIRGRERLAALAAGLAPREGARLERLWINPTSHAPPVTCACRVATLDGRDVLVTLIVGAVPVPPRPSPARSDGPPGGLPLQPTPPAQPAPPAQPVPPAQPRETNVPAPMPEAASEARSVLRFVWQMDADTRFTQVSSELSDGVGARAADIVGRTWADLTGTRVEDLDGGIADCLARRRTWSGRTAIWTMSGDRGRVPIDWAGMPVHGPDRALTGFRGFGLVRLDRLQPEPAEVAPAEVPPAEVGPREPGPSEPAPAPVSLPKARTSLPHASLPLATLTLPKAIFPLPLSEPRGQSTHQALETPQATATAVPQVPEASGETPVETDALLSADQIMPTETTTSDGNWFEELRERVAASLNQTAEDAAPALDDPAGDGPGRSHGPARTSDREASGLSSAERTAFREIARALGARLDEGKGQDSGAPDVKDSGFEHHDAEPPGVASPEPPPAPAPDLAPDEPPARPADAAVAASSASPVGAPVLDRLPVGVLVHRDGRILYANRFLLDLAAFADLGRIEAEGGLARLFAGSPSLLRSEEVGGPVALTTGERTTLAVEVRGTSVDWDDGPATLLAIRAVPEPEAAGNRHAADVELAARESRILELEAILDTATDGVIILDETGRVLSVNRSAEALFGYDQREVVGDAITVLLAPESHIVALDYLETLRSPGVRSLLNDGREVLGRVRQGGTIALFMTMGSLSEGPGRRFCAVLRDITAFKKAEGELMGARRAAEEANAQKSDLLAKISHEIRTPLNAIIGFAEVMMEERFGPIFNSRYKDYLRDVHASGTHVMSLVNDLLDLAKIEAGRMDLSFTSVNLNELASACFTLLQPQAMRERIVMRMSFAPKLPPVQADERSVRQILLNLVSNAIKFTDAGGQVILSTALSDRGEVAFRVRDTGIGMTPVEIEAALEPFRQIATAHRRGGTGLGLPLTKALVEANRGSLQIASNPSEGTLVEVLLPQARVANG